MIPVREAVLAGDLTAAPDAGGMVVFAHGSGSGRFSPRNRAVARALNRAGLATLLMDLLTIEEERRDAATGRLRFDIALLAQRVIGTIDWLRSDTTAGALPVGCFGASTGAAAALVAAAERPERVHAVVSRGGRPDLAADALPLVRAPRAPVTCSRRRARSSASRRSRPIGSAGTSCPDAELRRGTAQGACAPGVGSRADCAG